MDERLQKVLARAGIASRRHAEELIVQGRVTVNGQVVRELGSRADPARDRIAVDGRPIPAADRAIYLMLNKPAGYVTTHDDPEGRPTVYELVPPAPGLFSVGRLDQETEGLLLLTTDGDWAQRVVHPRYNVEREYEVHMRGPVSDEALERLRSGVALEDRWARPVAVYRASRPGFVNLLTIVMVEGRKREVRLLCAAAGLQVKRLIRRRIGPLLLGWLETGHWRYLDTREVETLAGHGRGAATSRHAAARERSEHATPGRRATEWRAGVGEPDGTHRNRRPGGVREVHDRALPGEHARLPISGHRRHVPGDHRPGDRPRDRSER